MTTRVDTKDAIIQCILGARQKLASLGVTNIGLFGSFVRGEQNSDSDVDVLVEFAPGQHSFDNFMDVCFLLEDMLGRKVEVLTPEALSPHLGLHILREVERVPVAA